MRSGGSSADGDEMNRLSSYLLGAMTWPYRSVPLLFRPKWRRNVLIKLSVVLDERVRAGLAQLGVAFQEKQIGDFHVFYALLRKVIPEELAPGALR